MIIVKKIFRILLIILLVLIIFGYMHYEQNIVSQNIDENKQFSSSQVEQVNTNNVWCGAFQLAWNELKTYLKGNVEFYNMEGMSEDIINELSVLNNNKFTKDMINVDDYYIKFSNAKDSTKKEIYNDIYNKFGFRTKFLDNLEIDNSQKIIYACIYKEFEFLNKFEHKRTMFVDNDNIQTEVQAFGIYYDSDNSDLVKNFDILYYNNYYNFAIKIYTKENDEVILCKSENLNELSFENLYQEILKNEENRKNDIEFKMGDSLTIPNINLACNIEYDNLCGIDKILKGTEGEYLTSVMQSINFELSQYGGKVNSQASISTGKMGGGPPLDSIAYSFNEPFVLFIKERGMPLPYFAIKIVDTTFLEEIN